MNDKICNFTEQIINLKKSASSYLYIMESHFELNEVTKKLPKHLHKFIVKQPYNEYTAQNQAVWRYVMRMNIDFLGKVAHKSYLKGLEKTGISLETIPYMEGMNRILKEIGWAAVSVDGFIPPNAFMEFQAYNVLVIASDMRTINHIQYTPAPDIIHEAAGHAPIIANPEYAEYLRRFGEIGSKAISSSKDYEMYEAIRLLSILKEDPSSSEKEIIDAQNAVEALQDNMGEMSEVGHMNLGAGRIVYQNLAKINKAIQDDTLAQEKTLLNAFDYAKKNNKKVTAAVFPFPEMSRQMVRQAWNDWNLDTAYPMLYQNFYRENINWIGFATKQGVSDVDFPIISGLYAPALRDANDLEKAITIAKENGAKGISIFTADGLTKEQQAVFVKMKNQE